MVFVDMRRTVGLTPTPPNEDKLVDKSLLFNNAQVGADLQPVVQRVIDYLKINAARAAAHHLNPQSAAKPEAGSPEEAFLDLYQAVGVNNIRQRRALANIAAEAPRLQNRFRALPLKSGVLSKLDTNFARSFKFQVQSNLFDDLPSLAPSLNTKLQTMAREAQALASSGKNLEAGQRIREALKAMIASRLTATEAEAAVAASTPGATELRLNLIKVKCLDEMDAEITDFGDDKIVMGGVGIDTTGQERRVSRFTVGTFSRNGSSTTFGGTPRRFVAFDLTRPGSWPRAFNVTMAMAEKDADGGFIEFLNAIWDAIDSEVVAALNSGLMAILVGTGAAAAAGALIGAEAAGVGAIVGVIVGAAVGFIVSWIFESLKDDIFDPVDVAAILASIQSGFDGNGSRRSPKLTTEFNRDGARYSVKYQWALQ